MDRWTQRFPLLETRTGTLCDGTLQYPRREAGIFFQGQSCYRVAAYRGKMLSLKNLHPYLKPKKNSTMRLKDPREVRREWALIRSWSLPAHPPSKNPYPC